MFARVVLLLAGGLIIPNRLLAQDLSPTLGAGAGFNYVWYAEADTGVYGFNANIRVPTSPTLSVEPNVNFGYRKETRDFGENRQTTIRNVWSVGLNVIVSRHAGDVRPYAGGGGGVFMERGVLETSIANGAGAGVHRQSRSTGPRIIAEGLVGVDVPAGRSAALFAEARVDALAVSGGGFSFWYLAGLRVSLR